MNSSPPPILHPEHPAHPARPEVLDQIDLRVGTVIEASAGTGKTFVLENLVLELLLTGRARLEEILIVTFTERATAELRARIGARIMRALGQLGDAAWSQTTASTSTSPAWASDDGPRGRLLEARSQLDSAAISTIHGFCQRILTEDPFSTQRLLLQEQADGRRLFSEVFRDRLRRVFAVVPDHADYLDACLARGDSVEALEHLLYRAFQSRGQWAHPYDEKALDQAMQWLAALDPDEPVITAAFRAMPGVKVAYVKSHFLAATECARRCLEGGTRGPFLAYLDAAPTFLKYLRILDNLDRGAATPASPKSESESQSAPTRSAATPLVSLAKALLDAAPSLEEALAQKYLPAIGALIRERKLAEGTFDYDDMITSVAEALDGPEGIGLTARIRERYRIALIDEAQDTEPAQWRIFKRCFLDSAGANAIVLVGDPKQAIYGFRGADVRTFLRASEDIVGRGGRRIFLAENFRSDAQVVDGTNAIFDSSGLVPFFTGDVRYDLPVSSARGPRAPAASAGVTLMTLDALAGAQRAGQARESIRHTIVRVISSLAESPTGHPDAVALSEIFVLTRSNAESLEVADALRAAGIPNALYKPDHLFGSVEAEHVRTLVAAIADPADRTARFQAWLTPFFGITLDELARNPDPVAEHPAHERLRAWHRLGVERDYPRLWSGILRDSGVARRLRLSPFSQRRLANYRQIFDVLLEETTRFPRTLVELVPWLTSLDAQRRSASAGSLDEPGTQKVETEAPAVQILTIHKAKGLEAECVFVYGAFTRRNLQKGQVHVFHRNDERVLRAGHVRRLATASQIAEEAEEEDQRLLYVALTRARRRLFLPFASRIPSLPASGLAKASEPETHDDSPLTRLTGAYRVVNRRLEVLARSPARFHELFSVAAVTPRTGATPEESAGGPDDDWRQRLAVWQPSAEVAGVVRRALAPREDEDLATTERRGFPITSYSRIKQAEGGYDRSVAMHLDEPPSLESGAGESNAARALQSAIAPTALDSAPLSAVALVGGVESGLFLHSLLEKLPLGELSPYPTWREEPEVRRVLQLELRRWERDPRQADAALAMVYAALTAAVPMPDGTVLPGIARAPRIRREMDFLFPLPAAVPLRARASTAEPGFVRGVLDAVFEHGGKVYFADWKSDTLADFSGQALARHIERNYALQIRLYSLAVVRMLGIAMPADGNADLQADFEARFGGLVYVFLRGLPSPARHRGPADVGVDGALPGLFIERPHWQDIQRWQAELPRLLAPPFTVRG